MEKLVKYFKNKKRCNKIKTHEKIESFYYSKNGRIWYIKTKLFYKNKKHWKTFYLLKGLILKDKHLTSSRYETKSEILKELPNFIKDINNFNNGKRKIKL